MSYSLRVLRDDPYRYWPLDDTVNDLANGATGVFNTVSPTTGAIVASGKLAHRFGGARNVTLPANILSPGTENQPFSIECWLQIESISITRSYGLLVKSNNMEGIWTTNGELIFSPIPDVEVRYLLPDLYARYHVVAVYNIESISLYVNSELVASTSLVGPEFTTAAANLISPLNYDADSRYLLSDVAIYRYALSGSIISSHYRAGSDTKSMLESTSYNYGALYEFVSTNVEENSIASLTAGGMNAAISGDYIISDEETPFISRYSDAGILLSSIDSAVTIPTDPDAIDSFTAIEGWFKVDEIRLNEGQTLFSMDVSTNTPQVFKDSSGIWSASYGTAYFNGEQVSEIPIVENEWFHLVFVPTSPAIAEIIVGNVAALSSGGGIRVHSLIAHMDVLSVESIKSRYNMLMNRNMVQIEDTDQIEIVENDPAMVTYSHAWSITGAG